LGWVWVVIVVLPPGYPDDVDSFVLPGMTS